MRCGISVKGGVHSLVGALRQVLASANKVQRPFAAPRMTEDLGLVSVGSMAQIRIGITI
jgi:hypothetical protein